MEKKKILTRIKNINEWLFDFRDDNPLADVNLVGQSREYVKGFRDGLTISLNL